MRGDEYDRKQVEKELDKFPKDISPEDAYNRLIYLLAEDYEPLVDEMKNLDKTYTLDRELPSGVKGETGKAGGKQVNVAILLDASGSMNEKVSGEVRWIWQNRLFSSLPLIYQRAPMSHSVCLDIRKEKVKRSPVKVARRFTPYPPMTQIVFSSNETNLVPKGGPHWRKGFETLEMILHSMLVTG